jgi:6-phosphogluconolactonase
MPLGERMMRRQIAIFIAAIVFLLAAIFASGTSQANAKGSYLIYVGTYTGPSSKGIYAYRFNAITGKSTSLGLVAETTNPSFLTIDRTRRFLYAVNEISDYQDQKSGGVSAFAIDRKTGKLTFLNEVPSRGADPCYVTLDKTGKYVLVANYGGGNVAAFPILKDGRLGEAAAFVQHTGRGHDPERQEGPHAHEIELANDNRFAIAADLGLDELLVYQFDAARGTLSPNNPPFAKVQAGSGPRHFAFHPSGKYVFVINEMGSTVTALSYDAAHGTLHEQQTISTLPKDFKGKNDTAEIEVHPNGKFLYGSNRGHDSIAVFAVGPKGMLKGVEYVSTEGKTPRSFAIDPTGSYLFAANQGSNKIVVFRIDSKTGHLTPTGEALEAPSPVCIKFVAIE